MKKWFKEKYIVILVAFYTGLVILDYKNIPSFLGFDMSNINWDFCLGALNGIVVVALYMITYKTIDRRTVERERNKKDISILFIKECYTECLEFIEILNQEIIEKYVVPKMNFNGTLSNNPIITNLQVNPFANESIIMDLLKDGQLTINQINSYLKIRQKYKQYINMRTTFFDAPHLYEPLKADLCNYINKEMSKLSI